MRLFMKDYREYARHILEEIIFLEKECQDILFDNFISNEVLKRASIRSLEIIGEAIKNIPAEILDKYPDTEWKNIARTRDRLIHHYFGIDYYLVWDIINIHLPKLKTDIEKIIRN